MPARSAWFRLGGRLGAGALVCSLAYGGLRAELLSEYFPNGVPGYGTAPGVTVASRQRPNFDPAGVRMGSFILHPQVDEGLGYDSNVFGGGNRSPGSWLIGTHPSLLIGSDWSRNSIGAYVGVSDLHYLDQPRQSFTDWTTSLGGTFSIGRHQLTVAASHLQLHQPRTDLDALPSDTPVAFQVNDVRASYLVPWGRFSITPSLSFTTYTYEATRIFGVPASQEYRDRNVLQGAVTTRYQLSPQHDLLVVGRLLEVNYTAPQLGQPTRNSTGAEFLLGMANEANAVWQYRVLLGWETRVFAAAQYATHQAPIAEAAVTWNPSGVTTLTASLTRSIEDAAQEGIAGYTYTSGRLVLDHEARRNLLLQASVGLQHADYLQGGGHAGALSLGAGATWLVNRHMRVSATYDFTDQRGTSNPTLQTTGNYVRSVGLITLRFGM
jgi:hypothetical protein